MLDFGTTDAHTDELSVAIYWDPTGVDLDAATPPTAAQVAAALLVGTDTSFAQAAMHKAKADARGKAFGPYEGGLSLPADGAHSAIQESMAVAPEMHDPEAYGLNEAARLFGSGCAWCNFSLTGTNGLYREWGIIDTIATPISSSTPKALAIKEFLLGQYTLFPATFTGGLIDGSSPVGTVAATIVKHHPNAALSIVDASGQFELSGLNIVSKVTPLTSSATVQIVQSSTGALNGPLSTNKTITVVNNDTGASTWNPSDKDAGITLSAGNVNAAGTNADSNVRAVRCISGLASGKYYFELGHGSPVGHERMGLGLLTSALGQHVGQDAHSVGWDSNGGVYINGVSVAAAVNTFGWNVIDCAVDIDNKLIWFRVENLVWIGSAGGADPATGLHGIDISSLGNGALHPMWSVQSVSGTTGLVALQRSGNNTYAPPTGFSLWPASV
jgi:hypothetical protein